MKMKILFFMTQFYQLGGSERLQVELAEELNKRQIHADILSMYSEDLPDVADVKIGLMDRGVPNVYFLNMSVHPSLTSLLPAIIELRKILIENEYDIIETSSLSTNVIASWATLTGRTRHVIGLHQVFKKERDNSIRHMFWRFSIRFNRRNRYYAISKFVNKAWQVYSNTPDRDVRTVYNAISNQFFDVMHDRKALFDELDLPNCGRILLYVGRLAKYKGCDTLFDAMAPCLIQKKLYLIYLGLVDPSVSGSLEMFDSMSKKILSAGLSDNVRFLGYRKDIPRIMASADILIHPTTIEGFGLTLVEALATGLPIVATNVEAIPEVLAGTDSIMIDPDNPSALREAVLKTLDRSADEVNRALEKGKKIAENYRLRNRTDLLVKYFDDIRFSHN